MAYWDNVATPSNKGMKSVAAQSGKKMSAANYERFTDANVKTVTPKPNTQGHAETRGNDKGTGKANVATSVELASKRKTNLKLPANY